jgi:hypothetical protein
MSDYSQAEVLLFGTEGHEAEVADLLTEFGFQVDYGAMSHEFDATEIRDGETYMHDSAGLMICSELGDKLEAIGVSYHVSQEAKYEWDGTVRIFTPRLGAFESVGSNDGDVLLHAHELDRVIEKWKEDGTHSPEPPSAAELVKRLQLLTGTAHRTWFEEKMKEVFDGGRSGEGSQ